MSSFMMLIWISLIVVLNVRAEVDLNDHGSICQHCHTKTLTECSAFDSLNHNLTIHCVQAGDEPCIIAVVESHAVSNEPDFMCFLNEPVEILDNEIQSKNFGNLVDDTDAAMTTELPTENASIEEVKSENEALPAQENAENNPEVEIVESIKEEHTTDVQREVTTAATNTDDNVMTQTNVMENSETNSIDEPDNMPQADQPIPVDKADEMPQADQPKLMDNAEEMPQADQPLVETEVENEQSTVIEDNKIESTVAVDEMPAETSKPMEEKNDIEPRMNTVEEKEDIVPKIEMFNCYACQSLTESDCITKPTRTVSCKTTEIGTNGCYTLLKDSHIERGCLNDLTKHISETCSNKSDMNCKFCYKNFCNNEIFPAEHQLCHQCANTSECAREQLTENAVPCPNYEVKDACFLYADENNKMQRGCKSSRELFERCLYFGEERCLTCSGKAGCNSQPLYSKPKLSCSSCDSRSGDKQALQNCAWTQAETSISKCQNEYLYYMKELCVMIYLSDIELSVRGCSNDIGACEPVYPWCYSCNTNGCNVKSLAIQSCLQCSSNDLMSCSSDLRGLAAENCKAEIRTYETRGCYVSWSSDSNITTRGCISDLTAEGIDYCKANKNLCIFCYEDGCNHHLAPSSAERKTAMNFAFILFGLLYIL